LVFVDVCEYSIMVDDDVMPSNPPIVWVEEEELEEAPLGMNVFQWMCKEESFRKMVRIQIDYSTWDHRLFPNPQALAI